MIQPFALEVNAFDGSVSGDYNSLAWEHLEHRSIVTNALGRSSPLVEQRADDVEFATGPKLDVATVIGVAHLVRLGSIASPGGLDAGSGSFQARGKAYNTSSSVVPRT